jgi:hypothetical protein
MVKSCKSPTFGALVVAKHLEVDVREFVEE